MKAQFVLCSETAILDQMSGGLSIINLFERLSVVGFPFFLPRMMVSALLARTEEEPSAGQAVLTIHLDDQEVASVAVGFDFQGRLASRALLGVEGFVVPAPGRITVRLESGGDVLGAFVFEAAKMGGDLQLTVQSTISPS